MASTEATAESMTNREQFCMGIYTISLLVTHLDGVVRGCASMAVPIFTLESIFAQNVSYLSKSHRAQVQRRDGSDAGRPSVEDYAADTYRHLPTELSRPSRVP
jgi:hypothetical protein